MSAPDKKAGTCGCERSHGSYYDPTPCGCICHERPAPAPASERGPEGAVLTLDVARERPHLGCWRMVDALRADLAREKERGDALRAVADTIHEVVAERDAAEAEAAADFCRADNATVRANEEKARADALAAEVEQLREDWRAAREDSDIARRNADKAEAEVRDLTVRYESSHASRIHAENCIADLERERDEVRAANESQAQQIAVIYAREERLTMDRDTALDTARKLNARVEILTAAIKDAPHEADCGYPSAKAVPITKLPRSKSTFYAERGPCDCWKSRAKAEVGK